jgi:hypothetical protein
VSLTYDTWRAVCIVLLLGIAWERFVSVWELVAAVSRLLVAKAFLSVSQETEVRSAWYRSVQKVVCSSWLSNSLKINIYRTIVLPFVLYGCETWLLRLREERRL